MEKLVGLYTGTQQMLEEPAYFKLLQSELGLTHVIMGGEYLLSEATQAKNPMPPGQESTAPCRGGVTDTELRRALDAAHDMGLQVWFCTGGWHGGGRGCPELCMTDMHHERMSEVPLMRYAIEQNSVALCPGNEPMSDWFRTVIAEVMATYPFEGVDLTHFRYTAPAFLHNLFGCGCPRCEALALRQGYDFDHMRRSVLNFWDRLQNLDAKAIRDAGDRGLGLMDLSEWLGLDAGLSQWFEFRAGVINGHLRSFKEAAHASADRPIMFGSDTFPPTFARLVGHSYKASMSWADYTSPLLSHVGVFVLSTFATYADTLCQWTDGLAEEYALRFVYRLFGYDHLDLPLRLEDIGIETPDFENNTKALYDIVELELHRARLYNTGEIPSYPVIKGATWSPDIVRRLMDAADKMGHEGIIFQGTDSLVKW